MCPFKNANINLGKENTYVMSFYLIAFNLKGAANILTPLMPWVMETMITENTVCS